MGWQSAELNQPRPKGVKIKNEMKLIASEDKKEFERLANKAQEEGFDLDNKTYTVIPYGNIAKINYSIIALKQTFSGE